MPASGPVSSRSSPIMRLISVDLPALGRPTMATLSGGSAILVVLVLAGRLFLGGTCGISASKRSAKPSPCSAENGTGSPSPARRPHRRRRAPALPSALLAIRMTGLPERRTTSAKGRSAGMTPTRASITNRITSASAMAASVWRACGRGASGSASSRPGGIDDAEFEVAETPRPRAGRGHPRAIVDERELPCRQAG